MSMASIKPLPASDTRIPASSASVDVSDSYDLDTLSDGLEED
jgi:hypothetical protein